jgi:primosomal protein N' (replication factor Y)
MKYAEILVDVANRRLDQSYHYLIPDDLKIEVGMTVVVTLKHRKVQGLVVKITEDRPDLEEGKFKPIDSVLEENCLIPRELIIWLFGWPKPQFVQLPRHYIRYGLF